MLSLSSLVTREKLPSAHIPDLEEWNYIVLAGSKYDVSSLWNFINIILFRVKRFRGTKRLNGYTWCKIKRFSGTKCPWKCIWCRLKRFCGTELCWRPGQWRWGCAGVMGAVWQRRSDSSRSNWIFLQIDVEESLFRIAVNWIFAIFIF